MLVKTEEWGRQRMLAPEKHTPPALPVCQQEKEPVRAAAGGAAKPTQRAFFTN